MAKRKLFNLFRKSQSGATAAEFALVFPAFIILLVGTLESALAIYSQTSVKHAVQEVARLAMVNKSMTAADMKTAIATKVAAVDVVANDITVTEISHGDGTATVNFSITYDHDVTIPFVMSRSIEMSSTSSILRAE